MTNIKEKEEKIREDIFAKIRELHQLRQSEEKFIPGESYVSYAGRIFDEKEIISMVGSVLDFWLTLGPYGKQFEKNLASFVDAKHALLTNSGSSANLLALSTLTSPKLKDRQLKPGDEVITAAAGFP